MVPFGVKLRDYEVICEINKDINTITDQFYFKTGFWGKQIGKETTELTPKLSEIPNQHLDDGFFFFFTKGTLQKGSKE